MSSVRDSRRTAVGLSIAVTEVARSSPYGVHEDDERYYITFLDGTGQRELCLLNLMSRPQLALLAARYINTASLFHSHQTRLKIRAKFSYFFSYLDQLESMFGVDVRSIEDVHQDIIDGYQAWLNGDAKYNSDLMIKPHTRKARYNFIRQVFDWAKTSDNYAKKVPDVVFRSHQWSRSYRKIESAESLNAVQIIALRRACHAEMTKIFRELEVGHRERQAGKTIDLEGISVVPFKSLSVKIQGLAAIIENDNLDVEAFRKKYKGLSRALKRPYGTIEEVIPYLIFTWRTVVPLIILLSLHTGYNPSDLCGLELSEIGDHPIWPNTIRVAPKKGRANGRYQARTFEKELSNPFAAASILAKLEQLTAWSRALADPRDRRFLFLVWTQLGQRPKPLIDRDGNIASQLYREISSFTTRHGLDKITLSALRQTVADLAHLVSEGDVNAVKTVMGHSSIRTSERHYNSKGQRARRTAQLANAVRDRQRYIDSGGQVALEGSGDGLLKRAATPGFLCWDILESPIPGQKKGRSCSAYGSCPGCPLACVKTDDPYAAGRLLQLQKALERARTQVAHLRWAVVWNPIYRALLDDWLPMLSASALSAAAKHPLPPLPDFD